MIVLAVNCGSSTLKFKLIEVGGSSPAELASGNVERIGGEQPAIRFFAQV